MQVGFIFDLDGVISETEEFHYLAWKKLTEEEDLPFTRDDSEMLRGLSRRDALETLLKGKILPEHRMQQLMERKNSYYLDFLSKLSSHHLLPGIMNFIADAKQLGIKLAIGSSSRNAREVCRRLNILNNFDVVGDGYSVVHTKPAPDLFLWVAGGLGLTPQQCVVFEDAKAGVDAALRGGFWVVGLGPIGRIGHAHQVRESLEGARASDYLPPFNI